MRTTAWMQEVEQRRERLPETQEQFFRRAESVSFPVLNDPDGAIAAHWGVRGVPASFIVDGAGQIRFVEVGYTTEIGLRLRLWLARAWT